MPVRFAPSPTGQLHLGHAFSALLNQQWAAHLGTPMLLRFEDLDFSRVRPHYYDDIKEDLTFLGVHWDGAPILQSGRLRAYQDGLNRLIDMGLVYPCPLSRKELSIFSGTQEGKDRHIEGAAPLLPRPTDHEIQSVLASSQDFCWRLDPAALAEEIGAANLHFSSNGMAIKVDPFLLGSVILGKKDGSFAYHLSVVVDDGFSGIDWVIRGEDLSPSTHIHVALQHVLAQPTPQYFHHPLMRDHHGQRLAKRYDSLSIKRLREKGETAQTIKKMILSQLPDGFDMPDFAPKNGGHHHA